MLEKANDEEYHKLAIQKLKMEEEIERVKVNHKKQKNQEFKNNLLLQMGQMSPSAGSVDLMSQMSPSSIGGANVAFASNRKRIPMESMT